MNNIIKGVSARQWAIFKQLWQLSTEERLLLDEDGFFIKRATVATLSEKISDNHDFKDFLFFNNNHYEVSYIDCSLDMITDINSLKLPPEKNLLLSFRKNAAAKLFLVIVKNPSDRIPQDELIARYQEI